MLLQDKVEITCSGRIKQYLENLGYSLPYTKDNRGRIGIKKGSKILIDIKDVPKGSSLKIKYKCGKIFTTSFYSIFSRKNSEYLKTGKTYCKKCAASFKCGKNNPNYKHGSNRFCEYRSNAKKRNIDFLLSAEQFKKIVNKPCHYCGGNSQDRGNGIDRKDSSKGYTVDNCVPCCSTCNMPYKDFILYIRKLYERTKDYEV